ncbi:hypothetical protein LMH87_003791 [Akanthomyces muscarius]|uniref:Major facilitator superfamily (MFS) profile domain-containing protein n=1 Tax=Akanthomyces muscarius TaxID=2231603 RepID=A0A9W8Q454_AKAMU|nr:hypothetical protein LMH87_003791 [Akanthomyces muscarius]KAJ4144924.1 hypothetical protein LMH87_003791 [Akanthomyces muscarius]
MLPSTTEKPPSADSDTHQVPITTAMDDIQKMGEPRSSEDVSVFPETSTDITEKLKDRYFSSVNYIGSLAAIGLAGMAGIGAFSLIAPVLSNINQDIGPDPNYVWISLSNNLTQAVMLTIVGRLSDLLGRRYCQIGGTALALIGCIVGAAATSINMLIGANVLIGLGSSTQVSFPYLIAEIVPIKNRYMASIYIYALLIPVSGVSSIVATALFNNTASTWRSSYFLIIAINAAALACWVLFYHPPSWNDLSNATSDSSQKKTSMLQQIDFIGLFLLAAGLLLFLMGLSWGGSVFQWKSAGVISTMAIGGLLLIAFVLFELRLDGPRSLVPMELFSNFQWVAVVGTLSMAASMYYAFNIVFPRQVDVLYSNVSPDRQGWLKCLIGGPPLLGQIVACLFATKIGRIKYQLVVASAVGAAFYGANACVTTTNMTTIVVLLCIGGFALGWVDALALVSLSVTLKNQRMIGTGVGVASALRTVISTSSATVYTAILNNRLGTTIPGTMTGALVQAGLPSSSVPSFIATIQTNPSQLTNIPGVSSRIISIGMEAFKSANAKAYTTVYLSTIAFSAVGVIFSLLTPKIESKLTDSITTRLKV